MKKKSHNVYVCSDCGMELPKWSGQCPSCKAWNTIVEYKETPHLAYSSSHVNKGYSVSDSQVEKLSNVSEHAIEKFSTGSIELDRVLGGGVVVGSIVLISGAPGSGKSTLLLDVLAYLSQQHPALYVSGEESKKQIKDRGDRLQLDLNHIDIMTISDIDNIIQTARQLSHQFIIIDSIQTCYLNHIESSAGNVAQVKESAATLSRFAKEHNITVFIAVHETKDGSTIAGPQTLSHIGDVTLKIYRESNSKYRTIRVMKNRFGSAEEIGTFAMMHNGLKDVVNPSAIFLEQSILASGNISYAANESGRILLVNIQALVDDSNSDNYQRGVVGVDHRRLMMLLAIIHKRMGIFIGNNDIYINVVGGIKLYQETGVDLPILLAILSSFKEQVFAHHTIAFGEVGLSGEVRPVTMGHERVKEAIRNGFKTIIIPKKNDSKQLHVDGVNIIAVEKITDCWQFFTK